MKFAIFALLLFSLFTPGAGMGADAGPAVIEKDKPAQCKAPSAAEKAGIVKAIAGYIEAGRKGDSKIAKESFADAATMSWRENGKLQVVPIEELYKFFDKGAGPASCELTVCCVANDVAIAQIESQFGDARFTDMFTLVKDGEQWKIVSKVYNLKK